MHCESKHYFSLKGQKAEQAVHEFAERTFLTDWCYPNPRRSDGTELCDLLVIFDAAAVIWQIKDLKLDASGKYKTAEVEKNLRQLEGARRVLFDLREPIELVNPRRGTELFDPSATSRVFLISVLMGQGEEYSTFMQAYKKLAVHVLTRDFAPVVMAELDTVSDFLRYLSAKEKLLESGLRLDVIGGEEELLAYYVLHEHSFKGFENADFIVMDQGCWEEVQKLPAYIEKQRQDEWSYGWDSIIDWAHEGSSGYEIVARELARPNRFQRRVLSKSFYECHVHAHEGDSTKLYSRIVPLDGTTYCFLYLDDPEPRTRRKELLQYLCYLARWRTKSNKKVVGIATERTLSPGFSYDFCLMQIDEWTEENDKSAKELQQATGMLLNVTECHVQEEELPGLPGSIEE